VKIYFSDFFEITPTVIENYGAFNPSLINDLPLFIDPFLLFDSDKDEYRKLHNEIIRYVKFLRDMSNQNGINKGLLASWFLFPEVKQNWFGYSKTGNGGSGLGSKFAESLNKNLNTVFNNFGTEEISNGSHLEKLCLIRDGVGRDNISDFTTNLIKGFLLEYTQKFTLAHIKPEDRKMHLIHRVRFNYETRRWVQAAFTLPTINRDFVLLTPKEILTKDDTWINKSDMINDFRDIASSIPNDQLRAQINDYFLRMLPDDQKKKEYTEAVAKTILKFPEYIDYFIKHKEDTGEEAKIISSIKIRETEELFNLNVKELVQCLANETTFYSKTPSSLDEAYNRIIFLKQIIENNDGYKFFYVDGHPVKREKDLQLLFRLTWFATNYDVNSEVNNGRGSVDYTVSMGSKDKMLVEFKLANNTKLKQNLKYQVNVYEQANQTDSSIKVILYFSDSELARLIKIFKELGISEGKNMITIDARPDKISASNVKH
jgi:hypothetical protein